MKEIIHNPSYDVLFAEETKPGLEGFEKGQVTELGAVNVMTGIYTRSFSKDKFFVMNEASKRILYGGLLKNTKTTTNLALKKLGLT